MEIKIGNRIVNNKVFSKPYIIAEAGVNHEGDIDKAFLMIEQAKKAGADAIKFQAYKAEKLASKNSPYYWDISKEPTRSQYELFKKYDKFWKKEFEKLVNYARKKGIDFMSTPFDIESADFLEPLVPAYKVASADITNLPFIRYVARKKKPILLSTGASTISEIWRAIDVIKDERNEDIILLHCVLNYPTKYENANLGMISDMKRKFPDYVIGYSDHTLSDKVEDIFITAWLSGAMVIEKHFTFNKSLPGNDHYHSMDKDDLEKVVKKIDFIHLIIGNMEKGYLNSEEISRRNARRSLVALKNIKKGEVIKADSITWKRPGIGVSPYLYEIVVGSIAMRDIKEDDIIKFGDFKVNE